jgi:hypothetical protein
VTGVVVTVKVTDTVPAGTVTVAGGVAGTVPAPPLTRLADIVIT